VKIKHERTSQRRHHRLTAPLNIKVNGQEVTTIDWSFGGLRVGEFPLEQLAIGDTVSVTLELPFQGFEISFDTSAKVVRLVEAEQEVALSFDALDQRQTDLMNHFISEIVAGRVTVVDDTLQRIDSPVTPASLEPDPNPLSDLPVSRWNFRQIGMSGLYLTVGLFLTGYFILTIYSNFFSMKLESGVVSAPIEQIVAPTDGKIQHVNAPLAHWVRGSSKLIDLEDPELEEDITLAMIEIERSDLALRQMRRTLDLAEEKNMEYQVFVQARIAECKVELEARNHELTLAQRDLKRIESLLENKLVSARDLDRAKAQVSESGRKAEQASLHLQTAENTLETLLASGRYFTGERLEGNVGEIRSELERLEAESDLTKKELAALQERRQRMNIAAPTDGRLVELIKGPGSAVRKGEVLGYFEREEARVVELFLTQSEVLYVSLGQAARVYVPALDKSVEARVTSVDRSTAYINEKSSGYIWRKSDDRTAKVTLMFNGVNESTVREQFSPGTPAIVLFPGQASSIMGEFVLSLRSQFKSLNDTSVSVAEI
jgi:multidrug resistance efflux pump